jgi:putative intracellular protease/amidase
MSAPTVVMLLPARDYDPTESAVIWAALDDAGVGVVFATPDGRPAYADERLVDGGFSVLSPVLMTKPGPLAAYRRMIASTAFASPVRHDAVGEPAALFVPGGHAKGVRTLMESAAAQSVAVSAMAAGVPVGAVCHGVLLLARSIDPRTGRSVLYGRRTTALTRALELGGWMMTRAWLGDYYRTYPTTVQDDVVAALADPADFDAGPRMTLRDSPDHLERGFTVHDGNYLSARWPGDCHRMAAEFCAVVLARHRDG